MADPVEHYKRNYDTFRADITAEIRREVFGEDIGQNGWLTADEYRLWFRFLGLNATSNVLEIACGSGGPAAFMARTTGCSITAIDYSDSAIEVAKQTAQDQGLDGQLHFQQGDASQALPFADQTFDVVVCIDAINHLRGRPEVLKEWYRVLKADGRVLFTDPITITGLLSHEEIAIRSSIGFFLFAPPDEDARLLEQAGFEVLMRQDATENMALIAGRWQEARAKRQADLIKLEGEAYYQNSQTFLAVAHKIASERRLSRFLFVARKP